MSDWFELHVSVTPETSDAISNYLFELGCTGCQEVEDKLIAYFPESIDKGSVKARVETFFDNLQQLGLPVATAACKLVDLKTRDWNAEWKKRFKPIIVSERFIVKPTWEKLHDPQGRFVLEIDPKQAFGTGSHATTRLMLQLLEDFPVSGKRVLDVGTGTGILAIAAVKLGAREVVGVDNDPVAIEAAGENVLQNLGDAGTVRLFVASPDTVALTGRFDLVLANLTKNVILKYLNDLVHLLAEEGSLIVSGILASELAALKTRLAPEGRIQLREERVLNEWVGLALTRIK